MIPTSRSHSRIRRVAIRATDQPAPEVEAGVENARLVIRHDVPQALRTGFVHPGAEYPTTVRLSNASGTRHGDFSPDLRGAALRVEAKDGTHDLLMTNFSVSHARNAREFVAFATAMAGAESRIAKAFALLVKLPLATLSAHRSKTARSSGPRTSRPPSRWRL